MQYLHIVDILVADLVIPHYVCWCNAIPSFFFAIMVVGLGVIHTMYVDLMQYPHQLY